MATRSTAKRLQTTETTGRTGFGFDLGSMTRAHWATAGLAGTTGLVHIYLYLTQGFLPFLFAGVVFLAAILGMLVIPYGHVARRAIYALGVPFTMGQIAAWIFTGMADFQLGVADKIVQIALIVMLVYLFRLER